MKKILLLVTLFVGSQIFAGVVGEPGTYPLGKIEITNNLNSPIHGVIYFKDFAYGFPEISPKNSSTIMRFRPIEGLTIQYDNKEFKLTQNQINKRISTEKILDSNKIKIEISKTTEGYNLQISSGENQKENFFFRN